MAAPGPNGPAGEPDVDAGISNPLELHVGYQLRRASAANLSRLASALAEWKLTITEASVLVLVDEHPDITQSALGRLLGMHRANMAPLASLLTERGVIERSRTEGRSQGLKTTRGGHELAVRVRHCMDAQEAAVLPGLTPDQRKDLIELLKQVWQT